MSKQMLWPNMFPKGPLFAVQKMRIMLNVFWTLLSASFVETQGGRKFTSLLGQVSLVMIVKLKKIATKDAHVNWPFSETTWTNYCGHFLGKRLGRRAAEKASLCVKRNCLLLR